jgi:hypothetical protein
VVVNDMSWSFLVAPVGIPSRPILARRRVGVGSIRALETANRSPSPPWGEFALSEILQCFPERIFKVGALDDR